MTQIRATRFPKLWNRLDSYLFAELHPPFLMAMLIYNGIFFINTFTKITGLAGDFELPISLFLFIFLSYVPEILYMTLPISFLFASQAAFARMSSDSEIIAPLSTGVSFWRMSRPVFAYGLFLTLFSFVLANWLEPNMSRLAEKRYQQFVQSQAIPNLTPGVITNFGKKDILYVDRIVDQTMYDLIYISHKNHEETVTFAGEAEMVNDGMAGLSLELKQARIQSFSKEAERTIETAYYERLKREFPQSKNKRTSLSNKVEGKMDSLQLFREARASGDIYSVYSIELIKRLWLSLSCLIFSLFAAPLAAKHSRLGSGSSFGISLSFIAVFLLLFKLGEEQASAHQMHPILAIGAAPLLFLSLGLLFQIGKHRGWSHYTQRLKDRWLTWQMRLKQHLRLIPGKLSKRKSAQKVGRRAAYTYRFPTKIDLYLVRFFLQTWFLVQCSVLVLILLIEYSQISSFAKKNQIDIGIVLEYLAFRLPELLDTTAFFCLLIAVLLVFAIMSKHQEVTAIRAGGGSLQRLCLPLIILGLFASVTSFYMENLLLPWSNRNAFRLRHIIKHKEPALFTRDVWIKTGPNQLLNFKFFDREEQTIHDAVFYTLDVAEHGLKQRSEHRKIAYTYKDGWINQEQAPVWNFSSKATGEEMSRSAIEKGARVDVGIELTDLEQKKRNPSEFSITQLRDYYNYLLELGYNGNRFYTEMLAKMAQPALPLIMMLLAMPMGFQFGRRGSFYGLGLGILTGLTFWVMFELFKKMGASGALPPAVAAWGVISVFSTIAVWRFAKMGQ